MIVKISRGAFVKGVIQYHESKVLDGVAELISNNTLEESTSRKISCFMETFDLNERVYKNKFAHFSFALSPDENLTSGQFQQVAREYLTQMGYTDVPELMYRHFDGNTEHIHAVVSSVQYSGAKISEWGDFEKGKNICRELEKKHGLKIVTGSSRTNKELSEINARKYSLSNALKKASKNGYPLPEILGTDPILEKISNDDFIGKFGKDQFENLYHDLDKHGFVYKTEKMVLEDKLEYLYSTSRTKEEFIEKVQHNDIYVRELLQKNIPVLEYGYNGMYFKEKQLESKYRYESLSKTYGQKIILPADTQKGKIKTEVVAALTYAKDYNNFVALLSYKGIEVKEAKNSGGVYGISFKVAGIENGEFFKASDVDRKLSFNNILKRLDENVVTGLKDDGMKVITKYTDVKPSKPKETEKPQESRPSANPLDAFKNTASDDQGQKKKKRKDQDKDNDNIQY